MHQMCWTEKKRKYCFKTDEYEYVVSLVAFYKFAHTIGSYKSPVDFNHFSSHSAWSLTFQFRTLREVRFYLHLLQWQYYAKGEIGP